MGTITKNVSAAEGMTSFRVLGEVDVGQVLNQIVPFLTTAPTRLVTWDLSQGTLQQLSGEDLRTIILRAGPYTGSRAGGRTAIVCVRDVDYGLSRMFGTMAEASEIPFEIRVFRDEAAARVWLNAAPESTDQDP